MQLLFPPQTLPTLQLVCPTTCLKQKRGSTRKLPWRYATTVHIAPSLRGQTSRGWHPYPHRDSTLKCLLLSCHANPSDNSTGNKLFCNPQMAQQDTIQTPGQHSQSKQDRGHCWQYCPAWHSLAILRASRACFNQNRRLQTEVPLHINKS